MKKLINFLTNPIFQNKKLKTNDSILNETEWTLFNKGYKTFRSRYLKIENENLILKPLLRTKIFYLILIIFGIFLALYGVIYFKNNQIELNNKTTTIILGLITLLFSVKKLKNLSCLNIFDKQKKIIILNRNKVLNFDDIYYIQVISYIYNYPNKKVYEINLILKDSSRINITQHSNQKIILEEAKQIEDFINKKVWISI